MRDVTRTRTDLVAENGLRQQLIVASRKVKGPSFKAHERGLLVLLSRMVHGWRDAVLLMKPETVLRWHREGFRVFWRWKSRRRTALEPKIPEDVIALIRLAPPAEIYESAAKWLKQLPPAHRALAQLRSEKLEAALEAQEQAEAWLVEEGEKSDAVRRLTGRSLR